MYMRQIAEAYLQQAQSPAAPMSRQSKSLILYGLGSLCLYSLLYLFNDEITRLAQATHHGQHGLFFLPILVALVFSAIHGTFTGKFWDSLGIRARAG